GCGPVHARRAGDPRPDRGAGVRRALSAPEPEPAGQARPAGPLSVGPARAIRGPGGRRPGGLGRGPEGPVNDPLAASYRFCGELSRREARNFYYSFLLLPPGRRRSMCALYAFLRRSDDLADGPGSAREKAGALDAWRGDLDRALSGSPDAWPGLP